MKLFVCYECLIEGGCILIAEADKQPTRCPWKGDANWKVIDLENLDELYFEEVDER